jgi:hypothetical protein
MIIITRISDWKLPTNPRLDSAIEETAREIKRIGISKEEYFRDRNPIV